MDWSQVPNIVLAVFTVVLAGATIALWRSTRRYANATDKLVDVTERYTEATDKMARNTEEHSELLTTQLLHNILMDHKNILTTGPTLEDGLSDEAIRAHLRRAAVKMLGEDFQRKVKLKLKKGHTLTEFVFSVVFNSGDEKIVSLLEWAAYKESRGGKADYFEVIEYIEPNNEGDNEGEE